MIIYWLLLLIIGYFALRNPRTKWNKLTTFLIWFFLVIIIGFRYQVGCDWDEYIRIVDELTIPLNELINSNSFLNNPLYKLSVWFAADNNLKVYGLNIIASIIFSYGLVYFCKQTKRPWLTLLVSIPYLVIVVAMGYVKQSIAIGILLIGFGKICNNEPNKFKYYSITASLFHFSSLVTSPLILICGDFKKRSTKIRLFIFLIIFSGILYYTISGGLDRLLIGYVEQVYKSEGSYIRFFLTIIPTLIFLVFRRRLSDNYSELNFLNGMSLLSIFLGILLIALESTVIVDRLLLYLIPIQMYIIGNFADFKLFKVSKKMITFSILLYSILIQYVWLTFANHSICWIPYKNILLPF